MWSHLIMSHPLPITINGLRKPSPNGRFISVGFNSSSVVENYSRFNVWRMGQISTFYDFFGCNFGVKTARKTVKSQLFEPHPHVFMF